jgi:hypothetical protein
MPYKVTSLIQEPKGIWTANVYSWRGCYCDRKRQTVVIHKEKRPCLKDIVELME